MFKVYLLFGTLNYGTLKRKFKCLLVIYKKIGKYIGGVSYVIIYLINIF